MRRGILALGVLLPVLAACGPSDSGKPTEPLAHVSPSVDKDQVFLSQVRVAAVSSWADNPPPDNELLLFPPKWCTAASEGHTVPWMLEGDGTDALYPVGDYWGTQIEDARTVIILAISTYCPQYRREAVTSLQAEGDY